MSHAPSSDADRRRRLIAAGVEGETAFRRSVRRFLLAGFAAGFVAGGLFGAQAILSEGLGTGLWFVFGIGLPVGIGGAILGVAPGILRGFARRRRVVRAHGFTLEEVRQAAAEEI